MKSSLFKATPSPMSQAPESIHNHLHPPRIHWRIFEWWIVWLRYLFIFSPFEGLIAATRGLLKPWMTWVRGVTSVDHASATISLSLFTWILMERLSVRTSPPRIMEPMRLRQLSKFPFLGWTSPAFECSLSR